MKGMAGKLMYETLKQYGVTHIFGLDEPVHLYQPMDKSVIRPITARDEKHAAIMAHGYARATHKPGVCGSMRGPAATNMVSGLAESLKSSTPVVAFIQESPPHKRGRNCASEFEMIPLLKTVTKWVQRIDDRNQACEMTRKAFRMATSGRPGPVALLCPDDIFIGEVEGDIYAEPGCDGCPSMRSRAGRASVAAAVEVLAAAKRPVFIAGGGCVLSQAWDEVVALAEMYNVPVATTQAGKGAITESHPLSIGVIGDYTGGKQGRGRIANQVVAESDVAFIMGSRTDQPPYMSWTLPKQGTKIIHLDVDPEEIGRNFKTAVAMVGDVKETLIDLMEYCRQNTVEIANERGVEQYARMKAEWLKDIEAFSISNETPIRPERLIKEFGEYVNTDTLIVSDASYATLWPLSHIDNMSGGSNFISPRGLSGVGWALPAAIGAKLGAPQKTVFCLTGDGAFGYVMNELETAARYNVKVITVVFNNSIFGFQKHYEQLEIGKSIEADLLDVDYSAVARDLRCEGERVTDPNAIKGALQRALEAKASYVLDVVLNPDVIAPLTLFDDFQAEAYH